jgi:hypothetical protein
VPGKVPPVPAFVSCSLSDRASQGVGELFRSHAKPRELLIHQSNCEVGASRLNSNLDASEHRLHQKDTDPAQITHHFRENEPCKVLVTCGVKTSCGQIDCNERGSRGLLRELPYELSPRSNGKRFADHAKTGASGRTLY